MLVNFDASCFSIECHSKYFLNLRIKFSNYGAVALQPDIYFQHLALSYLIVGLLVTFISAKSA